MKVIVIEHSVEHPLPDNQETHNLLPEIRNAFADYFVSEGCSCCRDIPKHQAAEERLSKLLYADMYEDQSGFDWHKYKTK